MKRARIQSVRTIWLHRYAAKRGRLQLMKPERCLNPLYAERSDHLAGAFCYDKYANKSEFNYCRQSSTTYKSPL